MKKIVSLVLLFSFISNVVLADCDFKTGIMPLSDGGYRYSEACHLKVGQLVQDNAIKDQQIQDLNKAITLKDLALQKSDDRANLWMNTSGQLEDRLTKVDSLEKKNDLLYVGLGVLGTVLAVWAAGQLRK